MDYQTIYAASQTPEAMSLAPAPYIVIDTPVAAGSKELWNALQVLVQLSTLVKADRHRAGEQYHDELYPLEGIWDVIESDTLDFEERLQPGQIMIRQPADVTSAEFDEHVRRLAQTVDETQREYLDAARLVTVDEGPSVQIRHIGPYAEEPASFAVVDRFLREQGLRRTAPATHREIYLVDVRTASPEAYETVLRVQVESA